MGYTHYHNQLRPMTPEEFQSFGRDVEKLVAELGSIPDVGQFEFRFGKLGSLEWPPKSPLFVKPEGVDGDSIVEAEAVGFNGCGPGGSDEEDWGHETFLVEREGSGFQFTKTQRKPYDALVCACLLALADSAPAAWEISTDGSVESWAPGYLLAKHALGRALPLELVKGGEPDEGGKMLRKVKAYESPWMLAQRQRREMEAKVPLASKVPGQARSI